MSKCFYVCVECVRCVCIFFGWFEEKREKNILLWVRVVCSTALSMKDEVGRLRIWTTQHTLTHGRTWWRGSASGVTLIRFICVSHSPRQCLLFCRHECELFFPFLFFARIIRVHFSVWLSDDPHVCAIARAREYIFLFGSSRSVTMNWWLHFHFFSANVWVCMCMCCGCRNFPFSVGFFFFVCLV